MLVCMLGFLSYRLCLPTRCHCDSHMYHYIGNIDFSFFFCDSIDFQQLSIWLYSGTKSHNSKFDEINYSTLCLFPTTGDPDFSHNQDPFLNESVDFCLFGFLKDKKNFVHQFVIYFFVTGYFVGIIFVSTWY